VVVGEVGWGGGGGGGGGVWGGGGGGWGVGCGEGKGKENYSQLYLRKRTGERGGVNKMGGTKKEERVSGGWKNRREMKDEDREP